MLRFLLVEAAQVTVRSLPEWRSQYFRSDDAPGTEDGESGDGAPTRHSFVLDALLGAGSRHCHGINFTN